MDNNYKFRKCIGCGKKGGHRINSRYMVVPKYECKYCSHIWYEDEEADR
jgi:DNA-directed RNA polymerase subunit RPC12/RpoP